MRDLHVLSCSHARVHSTLLHQPQYLPLQHLRHERARWTINPNRSQSPQELHLLRVPQRSWLRPTRAANRHPQPRCRGQRLDLPSRPKRLHGLLQEREGNSRNNRLQRIRALGRCRSAQPKQGSLNHRSHQGTHHHSRRRKRSSSPHRKLNQHCPAPLHPCCSDRRQTQVSHLPPHPQN